MVSNKKCRSCNEEKSLDEFAPRKDSPDGRRNDCRACQREYSRKWKRSNPDLVNASRRRHYAKNAESIVESKRKWQRNNPEKVLDMHLRREFGLSVEEFRKLESYQGYGCAACREPESVLKRDGTPRRLHVDHCHETGTVRGLLCTRCNLSLGYALDSPGRLRGLLAYVERHLESS